MKKTIQLIKKVISKIGLISIFSILFIEGNTQTTTVVYSGALSTYIVPAGVGLIKIEVRGSGGANGSGGGVGGLGARMIGDFTVIPGNVLNVYAGGNPGLQAGGQGSYVSLGSTPLIVAGGGGGGGWNQVGVNAPTTTSGLGPIITTYGAGAAGIAGNGGGAGPGAWGIGGGGGFYSAGANGAGSLGGAILCKASLGTTYAGGSGGGYSGGGGASMASGWGTKGGGAGGSYNTGTNQSNTAGYQSGYGSVIITVLSGLSITQTSTIACNGLLTAALSVSVTGVSGPFTYSWSPSGGTASTATGLGAGTYTCVATPSVGSAISNTFVITQPSVLVSTVASQTNVTCNAGANGAITLTTSGGTGPYTYSWSPSGGISATASGLVANTYSCIVKDVNLCSASVSPSATITQPASFSISASATNSIVCNGGSANLTGAGASTYTWTGGVINAVTFTPSSTTTYSLTGSNGLGCAASNTAVLTIYVGTTPTITVNSGVICNGSSITMVPSGASTYAYSSGSAVVTPTANTTYTVTGTSIGGCTNTAISSVAVNANPIVTVNSGAICNGSSFTIVPSGASTYSYSSGSAVVAPTANTSYTVTGTSVAGCANTAVSSVTVNANPLVTVTSGSICSGKSFTMVPSGASTYAYSSGSAVVTPTANTTYTVTGTSIGGCTNTAVSSVTVNANPLVTVTSGSICSGNSFTMVATGASTYVYSSGSAVVAPTANTSYTVTGTSVAGCANTAVSSVTVNTNPLVTVTSGSICSGKSFTMVATGASTYVWSPVTALSSSTGAFVTANPTVTTTYVISGTSVLGCVNSTNTTVYVFSSPTIIALASPTSVCTGSTSNISAVGATNYLWSPGGATTSGISVSPLVTSIYTVTGSNGLGALTCNTTQTVLVTIIPPATVTTSNLDSICLGGSTVVYASGGDTYNWNPTIGVSNPNSSSTTVKPTTTTVYNVTVSTLGQCPGTGTVTIIVNPLPIVYAGLDTTINIDESYVLNGTGNVMVGFLSPTEIPLICNFCSSLEVNPKVTTCYTLMGQNSYQCIAYDEICITVTKDYEIYIPNAFSPNGDIDNEYFIPEGYGWSSIILSVFDRWGTQVFKSHDDVRGWDGKYGEKLCEQGVYVYKVNLITMGGREFVRTGHVTLLSKIK